MGNKPLRVVGECQCDRETPVLVDFPRTHALTNNHSKDAVFVQCHACGHVVLCEKQVKDDNSGHGGGESS